MYVSDLTSYIKYVYLEEYRAEDSIKDCINLKSACNGSETG